LIPRVAELLYRWRIEEARKRLEEKGENEIYVTELVLCPLKPRFQRMYRELALAHSFSPLALLGEFAHIGIERVLREILGEDVVKVEVEYERGVEVDGRSYVIKGRVDAIVGDTVLEIKTSRSDANIPYQHHVQQLRIYLWLTGFSKGLLLYVTPERLVEYPVTDPASDGEILDAVRSIEVGEPAPRYPWECQYCPYAQLCPRRVRARA